MLISRVRPACCLGRSAQACLSACALACQTDAGPSAPLLLEVICRWWPTVREPSRRACSAAATAVAGPAARRWLDREGPTPNGRQAAGVGMRVIDSDKGIDKGAIPVAALSEEGPLHPPRALKVVLDSPASSDMVPGAGYWAATFRSMMQEGCARGSHASPSPSPAVLERFGPSALICPRSQAVPIPIKPTRAGSLEVRHGLESGQPTLINKYEAQTCSSNRAEKTNTRYKQATTPSIDIRVHTYVA